MYQAMVDGRLTLVTKEEYKTMFPWRKNLPIMAVAAANKRVSIKLRRRFSKRFRKYTDTHTQIIHCRHRGKPEPKPLKPPQLNRTIDALIDYYFDEVMQNGSQAIPARVDETDPEDTDDEFFDFIIKRPQDSLLGQVPVTPFQSDKAVVPPPLKWQKTPASNAKEEVYVLKAIVEDVSEESGGDSDNKNTSVTNESLDAAKILPDSGDECLPEAERKCTHRSRKQRISRK